MGENKSNFIRRLYLYSKVLLNQSRRRMFYYCRRRVRSVGFSLQSFPQIQLKWSGLITQSDQVAQGLYHLVVGNLCSKSLHPGYVVVSDIPTTDEYGDTWTALFILYYDDYNMINSFLS